MEWLEHLIAAYVAGMLLDSPPNHLLSKCSKGQLTKFEDHVTRTILETQGVQERMGLPVLELIDNWWALNVLPAIEKEWRRRDRGGREL